jgi:hypothetical protein
VHCESQWLYETQSEALADEKRANELSLFSSKKKIFTKAFDDTLRREINVEG